MVGQPREGRNERKRSQQQVWQVVHAWWLDATVCFLVCTRLTRDVDGTNKEHAERFSLQEQHTYMKTQFFRLGVRSPPETKCGRRKQEHANKQDDDDGFVASFARWAIDSIGRTNGRHKRESALLRAFHGI
jgi:hypothetical protein